MTTNALPARSWPSVDRRRPSLVRALSGRSKRRALVSFGVALAVWQLGATSAEWLGHALPVIGRVPAPTAVLAAWAHLVVTRGYWEGWALSAARVLVGFAAALAVGVPFALLLATV